MNTVRFSVAAVLLASAAATAATSPVLIQDESNANASPQLVEELAPADGKQVPAFDLPLVVRDDQGNLVLDARSEGPLPLARLASSAPQASEGGSQGTKDSQG